MIFASPGAPRIAASTASSIASTTRQGSQPNAPKESRLGFDGKSLIHPGQISRLPRRLGPVARGNYARAEPGRCASGGAERFEGAMIERDARRGGEAALERGQAPRGLANRPPWHGRVWPTITDSDIPLGLTFDDVLLQPLESTVLPSQADTRTQLTREIRSTFRCCPRRWTR